MSKTTNSGDGPDPLVEKVWQEVQELGFDLLNHKPERPPMDDLWAGFHAISEADRVS